MAFCRCFFLGIAMSAKLKFLGCVLGTLLLAACGSAAPIRTDSVACGPTVEASPPGAATPTGPTAMSPPPGYPPLMNPTVPMEVAATPSNMGYGGARTPSTESTVVARDDCVHAPRGSGS